MMLPVALVEMVVSKDSRGADDEGTESQESMTVVMSQCWVPVASEAPIRMTTLQKAKTT